jgi:PHD/YefM family antitoxin component YafN of YafNO toxin-antitoxin module
MDTPETVPASEFTRNFGRHRMRAQREPFAVSSHGQITGYFVSADEYEEFKRFRESRRTFATAELSEERVERIRALRMAARSGAGDQGGRRLPIPAPPRDHDPQDD